MTYPTLPAVTKADVRVDTCVQHTQHTQHTHTQHTQHTREHTTCTFYNTRSIKSTSLLPGKEQQSSRGNYTTSQVPRPTLRSGNQTTTQLAQCIQI